MQNLFVFHVSSKLFAFQYLNYVMKVMVSEILIKIYMVVKSIEYDQAEKATMNVTG